MKTTKRTIPIKTPAREFSFTAQVFNLAGGTTGDGWKQEEERACMEADRRAAEARQTQFINSHFQLVHIRD